MIKAKFYSGNMTQFYVAANTYPGLPPPKFYFDPSTGLFYMQKSAVGCNFVVTDRKIYYKEKKGRERLWQHQKDMIY